MNHHQIRKLFTDYFRHQGHHRIPSSSLVPDNDPSVLLTTAGMQQLKPYFMGQKDPQADFGSRRLTSIQRCFRTSDIEEVGDATHNTFFEMLGNFAVGDYFKAEAIQFAWEFLLESMHIPKEKLWVTVFAGDTTTPRDEEALKLWQEYVPVERIAFGSRQDNFWGPAGSDGPCGPSSEIHVDRRGQACARGQDCLPNCDCNRFVEIWNLVFTEFEKTPTGQYRPLKQKNIDTGMGFERLAMVLQETPTIFETDLFSTITKAILSLDADLKNDDEGTRRRVRIIADHIRAACFLIADGVEMSNKDQGYILRRIVRRAFDQFTEQNLDVSVFVKAVQETYGQAAPQLQTEQSKIVEILQSEYEAYRKILTQEVAEVLQKVRRVSTTEKSPQPSSRHLTPEEAFQLYSTHGLSVARLEREGYVFDKAAFNSLVESHQATSRAGAAQKFGGHGLGHGIATAGHTPEDIERITRYHTATHLLHAALRKILGDSVRQNGSDISPERLRFDFSFARKLTDEEKSAVEKLVNEKIAADLPVSAETLPYEEAQRQGALAFFREKYEPMVKVYRMGDFSLELCGGPHVEHTNQVGNIKILSEKSSSAGVRRIKATFVGSEEPKMLDTEQGNQ